jgi:smad nuclear-interacting protein 1
MDLETTNGTMLNGTRIEGARYYELRDKDVLKFGASDRDYVLMLDED